MNWLLFGGLALTGLAGSLHCVGMCGPLLIGLSRRLPAGRSFAWEVLAYHLGRIWTYVVLGLLAGGLGQRLHQALGARRGFLLVLALAIVVNGLLMLRRRTTRFEQRLAERFGALLRGVSGAVGVGGGQGFVARLLVGVVMGFTPCGLVWMALVPAAALGNPWWAALGMLSFGVGTVPALTGVALLERTISPRLRRQGRVLAAAALIVAGLWIAMRTLPLGGDDLAPAACPLHPEATLAGPSTRGLSRGG